ncbi:MAG TPA: (2Fe-2S) ferredoxin domain-containing protein, partial [Armatimonadota bacterium]|nr:(2Fe-2S) ferredoxin domain-containing protein [Armatimonadota bacterium]
MKRLESPDALRKLRTDLASRAGQEAVIRVCSTGCRALGALDVCEAFEREIERRDLGSRVRVVRTGCHGFCAGAVAVVIDPQGIFYQGVTAADAEDIIAETVLAGEVVERLCFTVDGEPLPLQKDIPFYKHQMRLVLRNCGRVDPTSLE